jgi:hypothetical protein
MKLSEIDKSKLPVKVISNITKGIFAVTFIGDEHALIYNNNGEPHAYRVNADIWSPCETPKTKVALYMYKLKTHTYWMHSPVYFTDDEDAKVSLGKDCELKRIMWSEVEVEQ